LTSISIFLAARATLASFYGRRAGYLELALGVELPDLVRDVGELLARRLLANNPGVGKDLIGVEAFSGVENEEVPDELFGHIRDGVPVG